MIDSVLKGTGNSRFLKSAVPAGTSWADALAMLQAGTFPIDFNGINTEGFQQVGTPLNKANLLKDATAAQIGLPPSTTPNGMFQALGNTGELHVWRKTVVTTEPIPEQPAGYNLGSKTNFLIGTPSRSSREPYINVMYANTVSVSNDGTVNISGDSSAISGWYPSNGDSPNYLQMRGKFIKITQFVYLDAPRTVDMDTVYYIPNDATATLPNYGSASGEFRIEMQKVIGYPYTPAIPAGTTTTYPVSTNPNAFQEGDDAKEAGYTLGDVVKDEFVVGSNNNGSYNSYFDVSSSISVSDSGNVSLVSPTNLGFYSSSDANAMRGKFVRLTKYGATPGGGASWKLPDQIVYIPSDTVTNQKKISAINSSTIWVTIDRYQPVTGYAAIPAGTTIEYLGKLGDKARVQVVSYVGTGTYGESNPCSLTFDFPPKVVMFLRGYKKGSNQFGFLTASHDTDNKVVTPESLTTTYTRYNGFGGNFGSYAKKSEDGKTIFWYNEDTSTQGNNAGYTYYYLALG